MPTHGLYSDGHDDLPLGILGVQLWPDNGAMQTRLFGWSQVVWSSRGGCDESRDEIDVVVDDDDEARRSRQGGVDNWTGALRKFFFRWRGFLPDSVSPGRLPFVPSSRNSPSIDSSVFFLRPPDFPTRQGERTRVPSSPVAVHIGQDFVLAVNGIGSWSECAVV